MCFSVERRSDGSIRFSVLQFSDVPFEALGAFELEHRAWAVLH